MSRKMICRHTRYYRCSDEYYYSERDREKTHKIKLRYYIYIFFIIKVKLIFREKHNSREICYLYPRTRGMMISQEESVEYIITGIRYESCSGSRVIRVSTRYAISDFTIDRSHTSFSTRATMIDRFSVITFSTTDPLPERTSISASVHMPDFLYICMTLGYTRVSPTFTGRARRGDIMERDEADGLVGSRRVFFGQDFSDIICFATGTTRGSVDFSVIFDISSISCPIFATSRSILHFSARNASTCFFVIEVATKGVSEVALWEDGCGEISVTTSPLLGRGMAHICLLSPLSGEDMIVGESIFQKPNTAINDVQNIPTQEAI